MKTLAELEAPAVIVRNVLEADLQKTCVSWTRGRDYWARKFSSMSQRSVPDYLFSKSDWGTIGDLKFACEFKKPGTKPKWSDKHKIHAMSTEAQLDEQAAMRLAGWYVFECDDFDKFKAIVHAYEKENWA